MNLWEIDWFERSNGVTVCFTLLQQMMEQEREFTARGESKIPSDYLLLMPDKVFREMKERNQTDAIRTVLDQAIRDHIRARGYVLAHGDLLLEFAPLAGSDYGCEALVNARLTVIAGREATDSFVDLRLNSTNVLIGRKPETSAIPIPPSFNKLSREHLRFDCHPARREFTLINLSERSITELNQQVVEPHQAVLLTDNSKIVIGADEHALMFHWRHRFAMLNL
ncbi:MAG: hypothetical protein OHK0029_19800 [Armatimonadaceae bacterium]